MGPVRIAVAGAAGRMGRSIVRSVLEDDECRLVAAVENSGSPYIGSDVGVLGAGTGKGVVITTDSSGSLRDADALLDFTAPAASTDLAQLAAERGVVHVIGTTGFTRDQESRIETASKKNVIIKSGNMSVGANVLAALVAQAAKALAGFDVQIIEMHHRMKKDAPSGTALMLGRAAAHGRRLPSEPAGGPLTDIGFVSLRGGTVVGEHKVIFAGPHEHLVLEHVAEDRTIFALGAIAAAKWGRTRNPGLYTMLDVLGLS